MSSPLVAVFGDPDISDVTLRVGLVEFQVHKMMLALHSSFFKSMFFSGFKEKDEKIVELKDCCPLALARILKLIYNHELNAHFLECPKENISDGEEEDEEPISLIQELIEGDCEDEDEEESMGEFFWKSVTPMMMLADRYDVPLVKTFIQKKLISLPCLWSEPTRCSFCVNRQIFSNTFEIEGFNMNFVPACVKAWSTQYSSFVPNCVPASALVSIMQSMCPRSSSKSSNDS